MVIIQNPFTTEDTKVHRGSEEPNSWLLYVPVVKLSLFLRKSPYPDAHRSNPLRWRLRNRATCPWRVRPSGWRAAVSRQSDRALPATCENMDVHRADPQ